MNKPFYYVLLAVLLIILAIFLYFKVFIQEVETINFDVVDSSDVENNLQIENSQDNIELIFVGDIMLSRGIGSIMEKQNNWRYPFLRMDEFLRNADLTIGN